MSELGDEQDQAEDLDETVEGQDDQPVDPSADDVPAEDYPPDRLHGVPFADADVTDESFAERDAQTEPEVWEQDRSRRI
jgi:hypothetical protein